MAARARQNGLLGRPSAGGAWVGAILASSSAPARHLERHGLAAADAAVVDPSSQLCPRAIRFRTWRRERTPRRSACGVRRAPNRTRRFGKITRTARSRCGIRNRRRPRTESRPGIREAAPSRSRGPSSRRSLPLTSSRLPRIPQSRASPAARANPGNRCRSRRRREARASRRATRCGPRQGTRRPDPPTLPFVRAPERSRSRHRRQRNSRVPPRFPEGPVPWPAVTPGHAVRRRLAGRDHAGCRLRIPARPRPRHPGDPRPGPKGRPDASHPTGARRAGRHRSVPASRSGGSGGGDLGGPRPRPAHPSGRRSRARTGASCRRPRPRQRHGERRPHLGGRLSVGRDARRSGCRPLFRGAAPVGSGRRSASERRAECGGALGADRFTRPACLTAAIWVPAPSPRRPWARVEGSRGEPFVSTLEPEPSSPNGRRKPLEHRDEVHALRILLGGQAVSRRFDPLVLWTLPGSPTVCAQAAARQGRRACSDSLRAYTTPENSCRYLASPETRRILGSSSTSTMNTSSGTSHSHVTPCGLAG